MGIQISLVWRERKGRRAATTCTWHSGTSTFPCKDTEGIESPGFPLILEGQMLHLPFCRPSIVCEQFLNGL